MDSTPTRRLGSRALQYVSKLESEFISTRTACANVLWTGFSLYLPEGSSSGVSSPLLVTCVGVRNQYWGGDGRSTKQKLSKAEETLFEIQEQGEANAPVTTVLLK